MILIVTCSHIRFGEHDDAFRNWRGTFIADDKADFRANEGFE